MQWQAVSRTQHGDFELPRGGGRGLSLQRRGLHDQCGLQVWAGLADEDRRVGQTIAGKGGAGMNCLM